MTDDCQNGNSLISSQPFSVLQVIYSIKHLLKSKALMAEDC